MQGNAQRIALPALGGDGEAVQPEKRQGVGNCLGCAQNPQRQVHALLGIVFTYFIRRMGNMDIIEG